MFCCHFQFQKFFGNIILTCSFVGTAFFKVSQNFLNDYLLKNWVHIVCHLKITANAPLAKASMEETGVNELYRHCSYLHAC